VKPFTDLFVIEVAGSIAGAYAGKLFSDHGARVVKVEPPRGDPMRRKGVLASDGTSAIFHALNTGKSSLCLDLETTVGRRDFAHLAGRADVIIESSSPYPLEPLADQLTDGAGCIRLRISPFGLDGPYASRASTPFTDFAISGHMYLTGEPDREPLQGAGPQSLYASGAYGFIGALTALHARESIGTGQDIDVSHFEAMVSLHQWTTVRYTHGGVVQRRAGNKYGSLHPSTIYQCKDGYVAFGAVSNEPLSRFLAVIGMEELLEDPRFESGATRFENARAFDSLLERWMREHNAGDVVRLAQEVRAPVAPVQTISGILADEHLNARSFWVIPDGESLRYPGPPFRMSGHQWLLRSSPAPCSAARDATVAGTDLWSSASMGGGGTSAGALAGLRILDLTRVWAGPLCTRILGDLGAEVLKVEAPWARGPKAVPQADVLISGRYPNNEAGERPWNREGNFNKLNRNKRSITLDLQSPEGKCLFEELVRTADVVIENYTPRVMPQLGLGSERLKELTPHVIYISMPGYGWTGPSRDFAALGTTLEPEAGLSSLMGYRDGGPYKSGVAWADPVAALHATSAILIALTDRKADPERLGQAIELAQIEGMICFIGEEVLAAQIRGSDPPRPGNQSAEYAPQGCYPCKGDDRWIALTVTGDVAWSALCGLADMGEEFRVMSMASRAANHGAIDNRIAAWTSGRDRDALVTTLQEHGIAAAAAADAKDLVTDEHLAARGFYADIEHPDAGRHLFPGLPIRLSRTEARYTRPAPCLGQHNQEVLGEFLGLTGEELQRLAEAGVIAEEPPQ
jgi:crotonobetainyl-CoA:carnitine CoA-transferase CaiB-like acyl-CoA transferase